MSASSAPTVDGKAAGKRNPLVLILLAVIVLLAVGGGGAAYYFYKQASEHPGKPVAPPPVFYALEPFTVNLNGGDDGDSDGSDGHYLHVGLTLKIPNADTQHQLAAYLPELRSRILLLITARKPSDLATVKGKNKLSDDIRATIEQPFVKDGGSIKIDSVLFTDFVIQ